MVAAYWTAWAIPLRNINSNKESSYVVMFMYTVARFDTVHTSRVDPAGCKRP
jgi:hypothetical protein